VWSREKLLRAVGDLRELATLGLLTPHPDPLPVEGRGSRLVPIRVHKQMEATHAGGSVLERRSATDPLLIWLLLPGGLRSPL